MERPLGRFPTRKGKRKVYRVYGARREMASYNSVEHCTRCPMLSGGFDLCFYCRIEIEAGLEWPWLTHDIHTKSKKALGNRRRAG